MIVDGIELTLLSEKESFGNRFKYGQLDVLKKYGTIATITDLVTLTGGYCGNSSTRNDDDSLKKEPVGFILDLLMALGMFVALTEMVPGLSHIVSHALAPSVQFCYHLAYSHKSPRTE